MHLPRCTARAVESSAGGMYQNLLIGSYVNGHLTRCEFGTIVKLAAVNSLKRGSEGPKVQERGLRLGEGLTLAPLLETRPDARTSASGRPSWLGPGVGGALSRDADAPSCAAFLPAISPNLLPHPPPGGPRQRPARPRDLHAGAQPTASAGIQLSGMTTDTISGLTGIFWPSAWPSSSCLSWVLDLLVPNIPESVEIKVKREYYLAKQALAENEALFGTHGAKVDQPHGSETGWAHKSKIPGANLASPSSSCSPSFPSEVRGQPVSSAERPGAWSARRRLLKAHPEPAHRAPSEAMAWLSSTRPHLG
ncbi:uncharacterized protein LOC134370117 [Cynocephalus volans]|uniref:uncharacterized protein LOC134370117 n=1 Tax=Cynocephalus volans TaxID=110931 RepID=UPI002FCA571F